MEHVKALAIKFAMSTVILFIILGAVYQIAFGNILLISVLVTGIAYVIGDMLVFPKFGNLVGTIGDFGLAFVSIFLIGSELFRMDVPLLAASFLASGLIAISEWFFHIYMDKYVLSDRPGYYARTDMMAEFAEENDLGDLYDPESAPNQKDYAAEKSKNE